MESASQPKPVMDVKAPAKPMAAASSPPPRPTASPPVAVATVVQQAAPVASPEPAARPTVSKPVAPAGMQTNQATPLPLHKAPVTEEEPSVQNQPTINVPEAPKSQPKIKKQKTSQGVTAVILLTLVAMVALSTLAVYMYTQS